MGALEWIVIVIGVVLVVAWVGWGPDLGKWFGDHGSWWGGGGAGGGGA